MNIRKRGALKFWPMEHHFTRKQLYDQVWRTPMARLASELGTSTGVLISLLRRANIPTPPIDYWTDNGRKELDEKPELPPASPGCLEPLILNTGSRGTGRPSRRTAELDRGELAVVATRRRSALDSITSQPVTMTREELHRAVWSTPMNRLAKRCGVSADVLTQICDRERIPWPTRGYWSKYAVGTAPPPIPLPKGDDSISIHPTLSTPTYGQVTGVGKLTTSTAATIPVQGNLVDPHPIIASWLAERKALMQLSLLREQDLVTFGGGGLKDFTETDDRRHRILDALFKAIEGHGGKIFQGKRVGELIAEIAGANITFQMREKQNYARRPLTAEERKSGVFREKRSRHELVPSGRFIMEVKTPKWPKSLKKLWVETDKQKMGNMLPEIFSVLIAAGSILFQQHMEEAAADYDFEIAEQRRHEEERRQHLDANRWLRFRELAGDWHERAIINNFLTALRARKVDPGVEVEGRSIAQWIAWAEDWVKRTDPIRDGIDGVFTRVAGDYEGK